jgi:hypothetical protein
MSLFVPAGVWTHASRRFSKTQTPSYDDPSKFGGGLICGDLRGLLETVRGRSMFDGIKTRHFDRALITSGLPSGLNRST